MGLFCPVFPGRSGVATGEAGGREGSGLQGGSVSSVRNQAQSRVKESGWQSLAGKMRAYKRRVKQYFSDHEKDTFCCVFSKKNTARQDDENHTGPSSRQRKTSKSESAYLHQFPEASKEEVQSLLEDEASWEDEVKAVERIEKDVAEIRKLAAIFARVEEKVCGKRKAGCFLSPGSRQQKISKLDIVPQPQPQPRPFTPVMPVPQYQLSEASEKQLQPVSGFAAKRQEIDEKFIRLSARAEVAAAQSAELLKANAAALSAIKGKRAHREDKIGDRRKAGFFLGQFFHQRKTRKSDIVHPHRLPEGSEARIDQLVAVEQKVAGKRKAGFLPLNFRNGQSPLENGKYGEVSLVMPGYGGKIGVYKVPHVNPETGRVYEGKESSLISEVDFLHRLSHDNIVKVLGRGENTDSESGAGSCGTHLVTQYIGCSLDQLMKMQRRTATGENPSFSPLPVKLIQSILRQVCSALDYLHDTKNTVHGDLHLGNIVITPGGKAVLCDFGEAYTYDYDKTDNERVADWRVKCRTALNAYGYRPEAIIGLVDNRYLGDGLYHLALGGLASMTEDRGRRKHRMFFPQGSSIIDEKIEALSPYYSGEWLSPQQARDLKDLLVKLLSARPRTPFTMKDALNHPFLREATQTAKEADQKEAAQRAARQREAARRVGDSWQP